jgi:N-acetylmuramoyl-L-alanine amidase
MQPLVIIDPGHGSIINGVYVTPGKRSPKWSDLPQLYEGVQNRQIADTLKTMLDAEGIPYVEVVDPTGTDDSLGARVARANATFPTRTRDSVYVSIHADAAGDGIKDHPATGISVYTSPGQTKSDILADKILEALAPNIGNKTKWRYELTEGDHDKESKFYVLTQTKMPAVLCELGFMTNRKECQMMHTQEWKTTCAQSILEGIKAYYKQQYPTL